KTFKIPHLAAVLKSNAYGHGLREMGHLFDINPNISHLVVDSIIEAKILREKNIRKPIIILGHVSRSALKDLKKFRCVLVINSLKQAEILSQEINFPLIVHIKIDTGLHRQGVSLEELVPTIKILKKNQHLRIEGLMSHLAAPASNKELSQHQLERWQEGVSIYKEQISNWRSHLFHILATAGINQFSQIENNLARIGSGLYGFDTTTEKNLLLKPILSFWAKVVNIKTVPKGEGVGYGFSWIAERDTRTATVACGYYEGVPRYLSNVGYFYYHDQPLKIIGRVSMNLTVVDISSISDLKLEDEIEVFSDDPNKKNSLSAVAEIGKTIPCEVMVRLSPQIKRVIK
ncbi:MAG: alanine racemase, partial [Candidatus Pacebacteria bacterium]|nr:alanine racemase [Candidatus Paceibacterota bacterium]